MRPSDPTAPATRADGARRAGAEGRGPVRFGPALPEPGLPVLPEVAAVVAGAAGRPHPEPAGGAPTLLEAARGHWERRGLAPEHGRIVAAPGGAALLLALTAALGGDVLVPRPCPAWWAPQARLLGREVFPVATPAECGGVPDPYALLETVRRVRAEGGDPRLLVLSVADDPTGTVPPPEVLHEAVEAAAGEGLHIVSDETWRDTVHPGHPGTGTVLFSPAEMFPDRVTVVTDLAGGHLPPALPAACARFAPTAHGERLADRALDFLTATGAVLAAPVAAAATYVLHEPEAVTAHRSLAVALHGALAAAAHRAVLAGGGLALPPRAGRHLYVDLDPLRPALTERGVTDAQDLEDFLSERLGMAAPGGHRFGDDPAALRVRLSTGPLLGSTPDECTASLTAREPLRLPHVAMQVNKVTAVLGELSGEGREDQR
ncbi:aminotransferase class I/II-fold pyridoxal phosphate-dependent enzyme [Streptomyces sp. NPDC046939]|uniref:aminotransferase class I/II-fold pyridoxal phosphate-dependent enzyme n=1 Tax=Streptomyces sp. NPDC046939 TaxID=3155376 RepID=UPI0033FB5269